MALRGSIHAFLLAGALLCLVGCGGGGGNTADSQRPTYRLVNASPDTPSLDVFINEEKKGNALPYGGATPDFVSLKPDLYDVTLRATGAAEDAWNQAFQFSNDQDTTMVACGLTNFGEEFFKRLRPAFVSVNRRPPNGSRARLIIVNAFNRKPDFENVPVDFKNPGDNPQYDVTNIGPGGSSVLEVDAGSQTFEMRLSGAEQVFVTKDLTLSAGKIYLVLLSGIEDAPGTQAPDIKLVELQPKSN